MPENPLTIELPLAALIVFAGGIVRGYSGFGSGMVMTPLLLLLWGPVDAIAVVVGTGVVGSAPFTIANAKHIDWRDAGPLLATALVFVPIGGVMLVSFDPLVIKRFIAGTILILALSQIAGWKYTGPRGVLPGGIAGAISGWANGVSSVGGPAAVMYLIALPDQARVQRANIAVTIYAHGLLLFATLAIAGRVGPATLMWSGLLLVPFLFGILVGGRMFHFLPAEVFRGVVLTLLIGLSILILAA